MPRKQVKKVKVNRNELVTQVMSMMGPERASSSGRVNPPVVTDTIRVTKRIQVSLPVPETGAALVSPAVLSAGIPGGLTYWRDMRVERLDFWSDHVITAVVGIDQLTITAAGNSDSGQTVAQYIDSGVPGHRRAHVGFKLGLLQRARFLSTADDTPLASVAYDGGASHVIVQATVELASNFIT